MEFKLLRLEHDMKVPSLEEVLAAGEQMCRDGKMDERTQKYYEEHGNHDVTLTAEDMLWLDELEDMNPDDFFISTTKLKPVDLCEGRKLSFEHDTDTYSNNNVAIMNEYHH